VCLMAGMYGGLAVYALRASAEAPVAWAVASAAALAGAMFSTSASYLWSRSSLDADDAVHGEEG